MQIKGSFAIALLSCLFAGCATPEAVPDATAIGLEPESGCVGLGCPPPPCGYATDYLNMPTKLNDGSDTYVLFASSVPAANGTETPIIAPLGSTITTITTRIDPANHTSLNGEVLPNLQLRKVGSDGVEHSVGSIAWDPYWNGSTYNPDPTAAANFSLPHNIVLTVNETVTDAFYFLTFAQEWGGGQAQSGVLCGTKMSYIPSGM